jgi:hypothetical protein
MFCKKLEIDLVHSRLNVNKKMRLNSLLLSVLFFNSTFSQILISEVNFDVPTSESLERTNNAHFGEFIELYNFTDKDISLEGWALYDFVSRFDFPEDAVIKSQDYIIVAYKNNLSSTFNPLVSFFPSCTGHEEKIIYQNKIILRNDRERLAIATHRINGKRLKKFHEIGHISYKTKSYVPVPQHPNHSNNHFNQLPLYNINNGYHPNFNPSNYGSSPSLHFQLNNQGVQNNIAIMAPPSPFFMQTVPSVMSYDDVVRPLLESIYENIEYTEEILAIRMMDCDKTIISVTQQPLFNESGLAMCPEYDTNGNLINWFVCSDGEDEDENLTDEYSPELIEAISSSIIIYPNPTYGGLSIQWDEAYIGAIQQLKISKHTGNTFFISPSLNAQNNFSTDISLQQTGLFVISFMLNTGQIISKNIIKY